MIAENAIEIEIELPEREREILEAVAAFRGLSVPEAALAVFLEGLEMADTIREHNQAGPHESIVRFTRAPIRKALCRVESKADCMKGKLRREEVLARCPNAKLRALRRARG